MSSASGGRKETAAMVTLAAEGTGETAAKELFASDAAVYLGNKVRGRAYAVRTLYNLRSAGELPHARRVSGRPVWRQADLDEWARRQVEAGGSFAAAR
jgi:hypothetical protein